MGNEKWQSDKELEQLIEAEFKKMPLIKAPAGFSARVVSAVSSRSGLRWWERPFNQWNLLCRIAFILLSISLIGGGLWITKSYVSLPQTLDESLLFNAANLVRIIINLITSLVGAVFLIIQTYKFWFLGILVFVGIVYSVCVAVGTAGIALAIKTSKEIENENCI